MTIISTNPTTEEKISEFTETSFNEIDACLEKAKVAQQKWFSKTKEERISIMLSMKKSFEDNQQELIDTINEECGFDKEETEGVCFDVFDGFTHYTEVYLKKENIDFPIDRTVFPESTSTIKYFPQGVIAQIGAWNYPLWQTMISAIPALLTGNAILFKPSERATKVGLLISKIINSTEGFLSDLFIPIIGGGKEGRYLVKSNVDAIVYTGNIKTGKEIIRNAGTKPTILELSGNDAAIVCADCDMDQTVEGIVSGAFLHSGQVCDRVKRIYVVREIADELIKRMVEKTKKVTDLITPLINKEALDKVKFQVLQTVEDGAEILVGGKMPEKKGFYFEPTILKLNSNDVTSVTEEIFGPVVSVLIVDSVEKAIKYTNATEFGLGTSIWTQDFKKAEKISDECETGMIWVNDSNIPLVCGEYFQGWKSTSIPNSSDRLSMFLKSKTIISFNSNSKRDWWF